MQAQDSSSQQPGTQQPGTPQPSSQPQQSPQPQPSSPSQSSSSTQGQGQGQEAQTPQYGVYLSVDPLAKVRYDNRYDMSLGFAYDHMKAGPTLLQ